MQFSRAFLRIAGLYLIVGMFLGAFMGASGDHRLAPVHGHINLLGFVLMSVYGLIYHVFPKMAEGRLVQVHFWLHQGGTLCLLVALWLMLSGRLTEEAVGPVMPVVEGALMIGTLCFVANLWRGLR